MPVEDNGFANNLMQAVSTTDKDEPYRSEPSHANAMTAFLFALRPVPAAEFGVQ